MPVPTHRTWINTEEKAKVLATAWGTELIPFLATLTFFHQDDLKKRITLLGGMDGLKKWVIIWFTPPIPKHMFSPKTFLQIILAATWLVQPSRMSLNQQRRPLSSLLYLSFFYAPTMFLVRRRLTFSTSCSVSASVRSDLDKSLDSTKHLKLRL